jgi:hypothetical protein
VGIMRRKKREGKKNHYSNYIEKNLISYLNN